MSDVRALENAARTSAVGVATRAAGPAFLVVVTWWFGPDVVGAYLVASSVAALALTVAHAGWSDATLVHGSRDFEESRADEAARLRLQSAVARGIVGAVASGAALGGAVSAFAMPLGSLLGPATPDLPAALALFAAALPAAAFAQAAVAATRIALRVGDEVTVLGFVQPVTLLVLASVAAVSGGGLVALAGAFAASRVAGACAAGALLARCHPPSALVVALVRARGPWPLRHVAQQTANQALGQLAGRVDLLFLSALGASPAVVGLYGTAAHVAGAIGQARLVFTAGLTPLAARYVAAGRTTELAGLLRRAAQLTTRTAAVAALAVAVLHREILRLFDAGYAAAVGPWFLLLVGAAYVGCVTGLAGSVLAGAGRTGTALLNAVAGAGVTAAVCATGVAAGPSGAAVAALAGALALGALHLVELKAMVGVAFPSPAAPHVGVGVALGLVAIAGDRLSWVAAVLGAAVLFLAAGPIRARVSTRLG